MTLWRDVAERSSARYLDARIVDRYLSHLVPRTNWTNFNNLGACRGPRIWTGTPRRANNGNRNVARYTPGLQTKGGSVSIYIQPDRPGIRSRMPDWAAYPRIPSSRPTAPGQHRCSVRRPN